MSETFLLPDLGEGLTEATVVTWLVEAGDVVTVDQPIVEVESAKSVVQLPCPHAGRVERLGAAIGDVIHEGDVLVEIDAATGETAVAESSPASPDGDASGAVLIGYGTRAKTASARSGRRFGRTTEPVTEAAPRSTGMPLDPDRRSPVVSPLVRRLARENGFEASQLLGSGADNLVMRRDVEAVVSAREATARASDTAPTDDAPTRTSAPGADRREALEPLRRAAADHFARSRREIPEATIWLDVDASPLLAARDEIQAATGERFGLTALLARFAIAGLVRHPVLNASFDSERSEIVHHDHVNLGIAAQTPRGLMVPVVRGAGELSLRDLAHGIDGAVSAARAASAPADAFRGGTFTLNNFGSLGVDGSAAIINHPEVAILGIGRFVERPWVVEGAICVRTVVELSFVFDHRVCDGQVAADFLTFVGRCIERPVALIAEI
ncbi:dihydrolipoamide acetyltransferase family protein [Agromyces atrinae]|uniref:Dihydrolipoamide acetyltransferase component of pyruvate dehydrogenase complex n=1 Tax=Agromyces atrinae TaxID=592376 RepID=A0A4Q2M3U8_9MICO|nr:dihydrolipoamide acetyltransferase family protein [Agromyces atrinae]NYD66181.1 pyruvate dehydrogenase E2 component (dihydrolipoamide acetyltransferase) [Agromyces atrinae]RXZ86519.1 2-oxo acid dehydrogenase subunit E2 [Agromyces atrinae]